MVKQLLQVAKIMFTFFYSEASPVFFEQSVFGRAVEIPWTLSLLLNRPLFTVFVKAFFCVCWYMLVF